MEQFFYLIIMMLLPVIQGKQDFTLIKAEQQYFAGGTVWSPSGYNYTVILKANRNLVNVKFFEIWIQNKRIVEIEARCLQRTIDFSDIDKGETVVITFSDIQIPQRSSHKNDSENSITPPMNDNQSVVDKKPPIEFSGVALICYVEKGLRKYIEIPEFEKQKPLLRP